MGLYWVPGPRETKPTCLRIGNLAQSQGAGIPIVQTPTGQKKKGVSNTPLGASHKGLFPGSLPFIYNILDLDSEASIIWTTAVEARVISMDNRKGTIGGLGGSTGAFPPLGVRLNGVCRGNDIFGI